MTLEIERDLILRGVGKSYGPVQVLQPTDLHVRSGEFLTIVGPSGSGKTTLLRMIAGFADVSCGSIQFQGRDLTQVPTHKRPFNTVFQDYALFPHMTVAENVGYGLMIRRQPKDVIGRKVEEALGIVGLEMLFDRKPSQLSGGQKQRVALARALVCEPKVLLLDEPLSALDAEMRGQMQVFLKDLQRRVKTTFILVTHDQEEAIIISDRIAVMSAGRIEQIGTHREVYYAPQTHFVANFFGDTNLINAIVRADDTIETAFGRFPRGTAARCNPGAVLLSVRPESIGIVAAEDAVAPAGHGQMLARAQVRKITFAGPMTRVVVAPEADPALELLVKVNSGQLSSSLEAGDTVALRLAASDLTIVPDAPGPVPLGSQAPSRPKPAPQQ